MACAICETRRPRRFCPGVRGDICTLCCGVEREVTVACPLDCEYLLEARLHDKAAEVDHGQVPNQDIHVTEEFLEQNEAVLVYLGQIVGATAAEVSDTIDFDVREGLEGLIKTYRTLQSGVYYESVPTNALAANIYAAVQRAVVTLREEEQKEYGMTRTRDADILGVLVFLQRLEFSRNNGRKRGRAFIHFLAITNQVPEAPSAESSPLILP